MAPRHRPEDELVRAGHGSTVASPQATLDELRQERGGRKKLLHNLDLGKMKGLRLEAFRVMPEEGLEPPTRGL